MIMDVLKGRLDCMGGLSPWNIKARVACVHALGETGDLIGELGSRAQNFLFGGWARGRYRTNLFGEVWQDNDFVENDQSAQVEGTKPSSKTCSNL